MALILPPWYFADQVDNLTGTPSSSLPTPTGFTANANNADGTAVSVLSALAFDAHYLIVGISGIVGSSVNSQCLLDILADPAGGTSWANLINDLTCGFTLANSATQGMTTFYCFPLFIKSGTSLGVQARTRHTSNLTNGRVAMWAYGNPSRPEMWWCGSKVESLGINAATSQGTDVTAGNSGAWGSWTNIGTSSQRYGAIQLGLNGSDATAAGAGYYWQIGAGSNKLAGSPTFYNACSTSESNNKAGWNHPIFCDIPASTAIQARGMCSTTAEVFNLAAYGVY
jgi:hypothetical protein